MAKQKRTAYIYTISFSYIWSYMSLKYAEWLNQQKHLLVPIYSNSSFALSYHVIIQYKKKL